MKSLLTSVLMLITLGLFAQQKNIPITVNLKDGSSIESKHFGQLKCGKNTYSANYIYLRGKYLGSIAEIKDYKGIEKLVLEGFNADPVASVGNEKSTVNIYKKDGAIIPLEDTEIFMTCYGVGDKYNEIIVQIDNPLTNQSAEKSIPTKDIQSIVFK